jgi:nucleoside-diphosphate-sugar epimerase
MLMDQIATQYSDENPELTIVGLRFFNVYGPREFYKGTHLHGNPAWASNFRWKGS